MTRAPRTEEGETTARGGRCAIVGRPNVGKSTLLNALLGQKLVIATPRPGTTRSSVLGVYVDDRPTQIAFVDTPGLHRPKSALGKVLVEQAKLGISDADVVLFMVEPLKGEPEIRGSDESVLELAAETGKPVVLAINKIDRVKQKSDLLPLITMFTERFPFEAVVPISALKRKQLMPLVDEIRSHLPEGLLYEDDILTDRSERFFVAEMVREAAMMQTRQEVPHGVACVLEEYVEDGNLVRIHATLIVEKKSHKGIVIGARGERIKAIGTSARHEIERFIGRKVFLKLWVRVEDAWTSDGHKARRLATEIEG